MCLFADDFYEDAVGEFAFQQMDYAAFYIAFEDLAGGFGGRSWLTPRSQIRDLGHPLR